MILTGYVCMYVCMYALAEVMLTYPDAEVALGSSSRIVSGWEAVEGQFPHMIGLRMVSANGGVFSCGASLIHNEWALTAAHCTAQRFDLVLRFGTVNLTRPTFIMESNLYYNHPAYNEALPTLVQANDIGVIKFRRRVEFNDFNVKPIRIQRSADKNKNYDGKQLVASGWGLTWTQGETSPENLNWVYLRGVTNEYCLRRFLISSLIQPSTICAAYFNVTSQSTCQGDSGGPLTIVDEDGELTLVGVTSFGSHTGCHTDFPAAFVRPGHYHNWLTQVTGIDFDWDFKNPESEASTPAPENESTQWPGASTNWPEASTQWDSASTNWPEASTQWDGASTNWPEASTQWDGASTNWPEASTQWDSASTNWPEASTQWDAASTNWPEQEPGASTNWPEQRPDASTSWPDQELGASTSWPEQGPGASTNWPEQ
ncbi:hypothetical protein ABMA28_008993 [Loxostege sticticalis]|uniref:Peptidase S1 domain-containing protein n=1 Tax=Loxostege sticticalis TaxID=481309 RepID=A0ABD0SFC8_LOXSC